MPFRQWQTARTLEQALLLLSTGCENLNFFPQQSTTIESLSAPADPRGSETAKNIKSALLESLFEALRSNTLCKGLSLSDTKARRSEIEALIGLLEVNKTLEYLKLGFLTDQVVEEMIWLIKSTVENKRLKEIYMPFNSFSEASLLKVVEALKSNENIEHLSFGGITLPNAAAKELEAILTSRRHEETTTPVGNPKVRSSMKMFGKKRGKKGKTEELPAQEQEKGFDDVFLKGTKGGFGNVFKSIKMSSPKSNTLKSLNKSVGTLGTLSSENPLYKTTL